MDSCSQACIDKINSYKNQIESLNKQLEVRAKAYQEQVDNLTRQLEDYSYDIYQLKKGQRPLKEKCDAAVKDFKRIAEEQSITKSYLMFAKEDIAKLTTELDALKAKYKENEFHIKKFDAARPAVEILIDEQTRYRNQEKEKKGIGYNEVPPPWNDNYTPPLETKESEKPMQYGKPTAAVAPTAEKQEDCAPTNKSESIEVKDSNDSTSCVDTVLVEDWVEEDNNNSKPVDSSNTNTVISDVSSSCVNQTEKPAAPAPSKTCGDVLNSKNPNGGKFKPQKFVKDGEVPFGPRPGPNKCVCACTCKNSFGPGPNPNYPPLKRQTCFNCGIAGHISRNCPHRPYIPYYAQGWQNVPRGRSSKRNPSRSRSSDDNWNEIKAKRQKARDTKDKTPDLRDAFTKPHWIRSKSSQGSSSSSHLKTKRKAKGNSAVKSSVEAPTRSNHNLFKPNYRWVPKGSLSKTHRTPVNSLHSLSDKQDMTWESVPSIDSNGKPSVKMDWVPKSN